MAMSSIVRDFLRKSPERNQREFVDDCTAKLPGEWKREILKRGLGWSDANLREKNLSLLHIKETMQNFCNIVSTDADIYELAREHVARLNDLFFYRGGYEDARAMAKVLCDGYLIEYPENFGKVGEMARVLDVAWWVRRLRKLNTVAREGVAIDSNMVNAKKNVYCSDVTLENRAAQLARNAKEMENVILRSESGQEMKLSDIAKAGMANQENRKAELMTRVSGFEELANKYGHKALFVTLTCPSRMHAMCKVEVKSKRYKRFGLEKEVICIPNVNYDGTKPNQAQKYLVHCWAKARALLAKHEVRFYGLRVAEPHHDGTPHWHMVLFYDGKESTAKKLKHWITKPFIEDSRAEIWNDITPRVKFVDICPSKGSATGYVVKYVSKNLGGIHGEKSDEAEIGSGFLAARVEAWASAWSIRQFQQVGGHSVTVWRELRRVDKQQAESVGGDLLKAWKAAQAIKGDFIELKKKNGETYKKRVTIKKANFAEYVEAMGGIWEHPKMSILALKDGYVTRVGRYGESLVRVIEGVRERYNRGIAKSNRERWVRV